MWSTYLLLEECSGPHSFKSSRRLDRTCSHGSSRCPKRGRRNVWVLLRTRLLIGMVSLLSRSVSPSKWQGQGRYKGWRSRPLPYSRSCNLTLQGIHIWGVVEDSGYFVRKLPSSTYGYYNQMQEKKKKKWQFSWITKKNLKILKIWNH